MIFTLLVGSFFLYSLVHQTIEANIESELNNTTTIILSMVRTAAKTSIKNHLRAAAAQNQKIVSWIYKKQVKGELSEAEAKSQARELLLNQSVGKTGYIYVINSKGAAVIHPNSQVEGKNYRHVAFVQEQIERKEGYLEYEWQNPGEDSPKPKSLFMNYFAPWDWIISVTSYRDEFAELIDVDDFRDSILALRFGKTGYSFVLNSKGDLILHPVLKGNAYQFSDAEGNQFVRQICTLKKGKMVYTWKNPEEKEYRKKLVIFNYIPEYDWIVASSCYLEESYAALRDVRTIILATIAATFLLALPITWLLSIYIVRPLKRLMTCFRKAGSGDLEVRMDDLSRDEIGELGGYFNTFMEELHRSNEKLGAEVKEREQAENASQRLEREILDISEREHQKIGRNLHDDLCPHLLGIEVLSAVLKQKLEEQSLPEARNAGKIQALIQDSIRKLKRLSKGLYPVDLPDHGFDSALADLAHLTQDIFGVTCHCSCQTVVRINDNTVAMHAYYIAHEGIHNAIKHAKAQNIFVSLCVREGKIILEIKDDGLGFEQEDDNRGMGLRIMNYRARRIGGELSVLKDQNGGTIITLVFDADPLAEKEHTRKNG
jgi:signal transduction histidine kinase